MTLEHRFFSELPTEARVIRQEIFVDEQGFKNEFDETDSSCTHLVLYADGAPAAVGRLFLTDGGVYALGRIAVKKQFRGKGLGSEVMKLLEEKVREYGGTKTAVSAQCRARGFYESLGYKASGTVYLDEFCEHIHMEKNLSAGE